MSRNLHLSGLIPFAENYPIMIFVLRTIVMIVVFFWSPPTPGFGENETPKSADKPDPEILGFVEKPGAFVPLHAPFVTEDGTPVHLTQVITGPTVLSIVYYKCPNACDFLLTGIAAILRPYSDKPETAPNLLSISIDDRETPADAREAKRIAFEAIERPYPKEKWHFLTGSKESIKAVTESVGFHYIKNGDDFDHPIGLIILSGKGQVTRYILGTDFLPLDLQMSLMEANTGTIQPTIARLVRLCFSYDPKSHGYVFNMLQVSAVVILSFAGIFVLYLIISGRKKRMEGVRK